MISVNSESQLLPGEELQQTIDSQGLVSPEPAAANTNTEHLSENTAQEPVRHAFDRTSSVVRSLPSLSTERENSLNDPQVDPNSIPTPIVEASSENLSIWIRLLNCTFCNCVNTLHLPERISRLCQKESNFLSAICSMAVIVNVCSAMTEPRWFYIRGGGCRNPFNTQIHVLGVNQFFYPGHFLFQIKQNSSAGSIPKEIYQYHSNSNFILLDCVNPLMVKIFHAIIALCFMVIVTSSIAFFLDLSGPNNKTIRTLRRNGIFNILGVIFCVTINGFCFWLSEELQRLQSHTRQVPGSRVVITFTVSFYLITAAGALSVLATAFNLLRRSPLPASEHDSFTSRIHPYSYLIEDNEPPDPASTVVPITADLARIATSPPPYTP